MLYGTGFGSASSITDRLSILYTSYTLSLNTSAREFAIAALVSGSLFDSVI